MDSGFWAARIHRHVPAVQSASLLTPNSVMEDEVRAWFPCPFCYLEIQLPLLCVHLREEHCFDFQNAVCPLCAENFGRDAIVHFTVQHSHSIKRRRRCQKSGWSNASVNVIRDMRELTSFLGGVDSLSDPGSGNELPTPDPVLSPFICSMPLAVSRDSLDNIAAETSGESSKSSPCSEIEEQDYEERRQRAAFLQELLMSTIF